MDDFYEVLNQKFGIMPPTKYDQDWEWTCGKSSQTEGYIAFYHEYFDSMTDEQKYSVINMIIQGFDDMLCAPSDVDSVQMAAIWSEIENILVKEKQIHANTIKYWASLSVSLEDAFYVSKYMRELVRSLGLEWYDVVNDLDIEELNNIYDFFEDSRIVSMNYISGDTVAENLVGTIRQDNDLKILFQRLDANPFSIELWFTHTKQIRFIFTNSSDKCLSDIMRAKVCRNSRSFFWTTWDEFAPDNEEHLSLNDIVLVEAEGLKWRYVES